MTPEQKMSILAESFPALRGKFADAEANGLLPWNFLRLVEASRPWSAGEKIVVSFLAEVWNQFDCQDYVERFSVVEAMSRLDRANQRALANWAASPFSC